MRVLVVEDEPRMASVLERTLREEGATVDVTASGDGLSLLVVDRPEVLAEFGVELEQEPPVQFLFRAGHPDRVVCTTPPYAGSSGFFLRDDAGRVNAINVFGRHAPRTG